MSDEACSWQLKGSNISEIRCAIYTCQDKLFLYSNVQHVGHCPVELPSCNKISPASFMLINEIQALMGIDPSLEEKKKDGQDYTSPSIWGSRPNCSKNIQTADMLICSSWELIQGDEHLKFILQHTLQDMKDPSVGHELITSQNDLLTIKK